MINNKREATPLFFILMLVHALLKTGQHILSFGQRVLVLGTFLKVQTAFGGVAFRSKKLKVKFTNNPSAQN